jgi:hypothetical protein
VKPSCQSGVVINRTPSVGPAGACARTCASVEHVELDGMIDQPAIRYSEKKAISLISGPGVGLVDEWQSLRIFVRMPRYPILPVQCVSCGSLPNESRCVQQKIDYWLVRPHTQSIDSSEPTCPKSLSPVLDLGVMTTSAPRLVVIDDQGAPWSRGTRRISLIPYR